MRREEHGLKWVGRSVGRGQQKLLVMFAPPTSLDSFTRPSLLSFFLSLGGAVQWKQRGSFFTVLAFLRQVFQRLLHL